MPVSMTSEELARRLRIHAVEMAHFSGESHVASALSMCDIVAVLYRHILRVDPGDPGWEGRDRFFLSKGHACSALYAVLAETGFFDPALLNGQCQNGSPLSGHVTRKGVPGVEWSTGSLGHGCCAAAGAALNGKLKKKDYRVYCLLGDGECDEGSVWEMALFAHQYGLDNLCVIVDQNGMQAMGRTEKVADHIDLAKKWEAFGWEVRQADGHSHRALREALEGPLAGAPLCLIAHTVKGKGVSFMENNLLWHYRDPQGEFFENALRELEER